MTLWLSVAVGAVVLGAAPALVFAAVGGFMLYAGIKNQKLARASEIWPLTGGEVLVSEIAKRTKNRISGVQTTHYRPQLRYTYKVGGIAYESNVIRFGTLEGSLAEAQGFTGKYPVGAVVAVRYNPDKPKQATLESEWAGGQQIVLGGLFLIAPLLIVLAGAVVWFGGSLELFPDLAEPLDKPN